MKLRLKSVRSGHYPRDHGTPHAFPGRRTLLIRARIRQGCSSRRANGLLPAVRLGFSNYDSAIIDSILSSAQQFGGKKALFEACCLLLNFDFRACSDEVEQRRILEVMPRSLLRRVVEKVRQKPLSWDFNSGPLESRQLVELLSMSLCYRYNRLMPDLVRLPIQYILRVTPSLYGGSGRKADMDRFNALCNAGVDRFELIRGKVIKEFLIRRIDGKVRPHGICMRTLTRLDVGAVREGLDFLRILLGPAAPNSLETWTKRCQIVESQSPMLKQ